MRSCSNCKNHYQQSCIGTVMCPGWEMSDTEEECVSRAASCDRYAEGDAYLFDEDDYTPSSTAGDYSPSSPWNAPGMSVKDFF